MTNQSEANRLIDLNRPAPGSTRTDVPFQSGGGKFYTRRMLSNLKHCEIVQNSRVKRGEQQKLKPLFYGYAW